MKITGEHFISQYLGERLRVPRETEQRSWQQRWFDPQGDRPATTDRQIPQSSFDEKINDVCSACNAERLDPEIEQPVRDLIVRLALGQECTVNAADSKALARWAAKTACLAALRDKGERHIPPEHYRWLLERSQPPPLTRVSIGRANAGTDM